MIERVALVTGAGRGLGRATAFALARRGIRVMAAALEADELASLAEEEPIEWLAESVATHAGRARIVAETHARLGPIDILVNNAGVSYGQLDKPKLPIWDADTEVWRSMMEINLDAPFELARAVTGGMVERGWGRIIMVSSTSGLIGQYGSAAYCASKHGLIGLARSIAQDVARFGVTCNAIAPGYMRTKATETSARRDAEEQRITVEDVWRNRAAMYPSGRIVAPDEVADVIAYIASEQAAGINGETMRVAMGGLL